MVFELKANNPMLEYIIKTNAYEIYVNNITHLL